MQLSKFALLEILNSYYELGMTLEEISKVYNVSKPTLSRIIANAKDQGLVKVYLNLPTWFNVDVQNKLASLYPETNVIVTDNNINQNDRQYSYLINVFSTMLLDYYVNDGMTICVTGSRTLKKVIEAILPEIKQDLKWIPMLGGLNAICSDSSANDICREFARVCGGTPYFMNAPAIVDNIAVGEYLLDYSIVWDVINLAKKSDLTLVGIGGVDEDSLFSSEGMISQRENQELIDRGAVGNISGRFFTIDGQPVNGITGKKMIGVSFDDIANMKHVIAIASGSRKVEAVRGALNGGLIKTLFTDVKTAKLIYKNEKDYRKKTPGKQ